MSDERSRLASQSRYAFAPEWADDDQDRLGGEELDPLAELARIIGDESILADPQAVDQGYDHTYDQTELADDFDAAVDEGDFGSPAPYDQAYDPRAAVSSDAEAYDQDYYEDDYDRQDPAAWSGAEDDLYGTDEGGEDTLFEEGYDWPEEGHLAADGSPVDHALPFPELDDEAFDLEHGRPAMAASEAPRRGFLSRPGLLRPAVFVSAAVLLMVLIGSSLLSMFRGEPVPLPDGAPPVIHADGRPYKIAPDRRVADSDERLGQAVYDRVAGTEAPRVEQIAPRAEKPVIAPNGTAPRVISTRREDQTDGADLIKRSQTVAIDMVDTQATREKQALVGTSTGDETDSGDAPVVGGRRVRTVIVPAGSGEARGAASGAPSNATTVRTAALEPARPTIRPKPRPAPVSLVPTADRAFRPAPSQVAQASGGSGPVNLMMVGAAPQAAAQPAAPSPTPVAVPAGSASLSGGYVVQLTARRSEDQAREAFVGLRRRFPSILGPYQPNVLRADLGDRGVYYRVRIGPMAQRGDAISLCERLKSAGGDCLVLQN